MFGVFGCEMWFLERFFVLIFVKLKMTIYHASLDGPLVNRLSIRFGCR